ncbi:MAG: ABC transporter ATP-binding protein, partial [Oscillospiraceae bacterium]|nr:ABC transporter ATP-binding protein [Oscillospiraceae bacterium]
MARRNRYDMDEELETPFNMAQFRRMLHYALPYKKIMLLVLIVMIAASALSMLSPYLLKIAMDTAIPGHDVRLLLILAAIYLVVVLVVAFFTSYRMRTMNVIGQSIIHDLRLDMYRHLQRLPFSYFDSRPHGKILVRIVHYVNSVSDLLSSGLINAVVDAISLVIILAYMILTDAGLTLYGLLGLPLLVLGIFSLKGLQRRARRRLNQSSSNLTAYVQESMQGMTITQLFAREAENRQTFRELGDNYHHRWMDVVRLDLLFWPMTDFIGSVTVAFLYGLVVWWVRSQTGPAVPVGTMIAFIAYVQRFWAPINNLANFYTQLLNGASYIERIFEFLDEPLEIEDAPGARPLPRIDGKVEFCDVTFSYEPGHPILEHLSFTAQAGESIALVGPTGAGKSTVVNLISRFYNLDSGKILIDGHDISQVTLDSLRSQMGIMLQDPYLFPTTIMENIRYGRLDATDQECIEAARAVCAHDFIMRHPDGYQTVIREHGSGVSSGERQLISFARVMLSAPRILILDE